MAITDDHLNAWRHFLTAHSKLLAEIGEQLEQAEAIPLNWYDVLIELYEATDHRLRMSELAERVLLTRSGITRLIDQMEKRDLITRELDPKDRRSFYAVLTEAGIAAMRHAWPIYSAGIEQHFAQHMSLSEAKMLGTLFERMVQALPSDTK